MLAVWRQISQPKAVLETTTTDLINAIRQGIADRGFFLLRNDRLSLIFGDSYIGNDLRSHLAVINAFAEKHKWRADVDRSAVDRSTVLFWPAD